MENEERTIYRNCYKADYISLFWEPSASDPEPLRDGPRDSDYSSKLKRVAPFKEGK